MSASQNRFLLPGSANTATTSNTGQASTSSQDTSQNNENNNQHSVDTDFDSYWEEEARNPHRNRIRIGRQYQATVPPLLKGPDPEKDQRNLEQLETLSFCPKRSAKVSDAELDHYFTVAKSLNLFASLVETRSLLGRDVTIADLNHIRRKEGLSLASVIQPPGRQTANYCNPNVVAPNNLLTAQSLNATTSSSSNQQPLQSPQKSPPTNCDKAGTSSVSSSPKDLTANLLLEGQFQTLNQPLMKALSHFISLHHPCHHDRECKKLLKDTPLEVESGPAVSITAGNLRQGSSSFSSKSETKAGRSRSSLKQAASNAAAAAAAASSSSGPLQATATTSREETQAVNLADKGDSQEQSQTNVVGGGDSVQSPSYDDWTREEVELFSKAIEVCGKNFSSIKKEFLPSKSVRSIVEYYYIGSRDVSDNKKKSNPPVDTSDACSSPEKPMANNNGQGGGGGGSSSASGKSGPSSNVTGGGGGSTSNSNTTNSSSRTATTTTTNPKNDPNTPTKTSIDSSERTKQNQTNHEHPPNNKAAPNSKNSKSCNNAQDLNGSSGNIVKSTKNIDPRMSVYNFDEEFKDDSPIRFDCPRPGAEVKPLKAKPIIPNSSIDSDASNSNVGSLKFFMDGQLVLKLNACQEQQEGIEKCHWVQSGDKVINASRQKRYSKKADKSLADFNQNGSQSNSVVSSFQDDDSKNDDLTGDEDSKESMNSFSSSNMPQQQTMTTKSGHGSPSSKRLKIKSEQQPNGIQQQGQLTSPIDYNRMAVNNRMKERTDNLNPSPIMNQAAAMPWLQANSFAMAAALLGGLPFPPAAGNLIDPHSQGNVNSTLNMTSKPMDLTLEHSAPKSIQKSTSRSKARPKNN